MNITKPISNLRGRIDRSSGGIGRLLDALAGRRGTDRLAPGTLPPLTGWRSGRGEHTVAVLVYRGVASSEVQMVGAALGEALEADVRFVSAEPGEVVAVEPARVLLAEPLDAVPAPYGLVIPGGLAWQREAQRPEVVAWLTAAARSARGVLAVSTGSLLLAATGLLDGQEAAGHWLAGELLTDLGASLSSERVVHRSLVATASGALAGVEAADRLAVEMRFGP